MFANTQFFSRTMADSWEEEETNVTPKPPKPPKQENQKCLASKCEEVRQDKHRWCSNHKRQAEAIVYQATKANKQAECKEIMQDDSGAQAAMEEFDNINPIGKKFGKKSIIDWAQWHHKFSSKKFSRETTKQEPMTYPEFITWAEDRKKLSLSDAQKWWQEMDEDPSIDRDNNGRGGAKQLWVPKKRQRERGTERAEEDALTEGSKQQKMIIEQKGELLHHLVKLSGNGSSSSFLQSLGKLDNTSVRALLENVSGGSTGSGQLASRSEEESGLSTEVVAEVTNNGKKRKVVLDSAVPVAHGAFEIMLETMRTKLNATINDLEKHEDLYDVDTERRKPFSLPLSHLRGSGRCDSDIIKQLRVAILGENLNCWTKEQLFLTKKSICERTNVVGR